MSSNTLLTLVDITNEAARVLTNSCLLANTFNRQYESRFAVDGKKAGDTINVRKPPRYIGRRGEQVSLEASTEQFVPLTLQPLFGCDIQFSTTDLTLNISDFSDRFVKPQVATVANMIDMYCATMYNQVYNQVGTPGTNPASQADALSLILGAQTMLHNNAAPNDGNRSFVIGPSMQAALVGNLAGLFNPGSTISRNFKLGAMGDDIMGFNFAMDQNIRKHQSGSTIDPTDTGTLGASVTEGATTLNVAGLAHVSGTLKKGDLIRITGRYGVNPQNREVWGNGAGDRFTAVVTADTVLSGGAHAAVPISPVIRGPQGSGATGQFQNVDTLPQSGDVITIVSVGATAGIASQSMAYHKDAFVFASVDLDLPGGDQEAHRVNENGIACRLWRGYNINSNAMICRFDVLAGAAAVYPELAVRAVGA